MQNNINKKAIKPLAPDLATKTAKPVQQSPGIAPQRLGTAATAATPKLPPAPIAVTRAPATQPPLPKSPEKTAGAEKAPMPAAARTVEVAFVLVAPTAKRVALCGEFNQWSPDATPMKRQDGGRWEATLALRPGRYQYKFVADGHWVDDPKARETVPNPHGSLNAVIEVRA